MVQDRSIGRKVFNFFNILFFLLVIAVVLFPYLNVLAKAFNDANDTALGGITIFPRKFTMENFKAVVLDAAFPKALLLTISVTVLGTLLGLLVQFMTAYVFLNKDLVGRNLLTYFFMIPMYFGGGLIPTYILYSKLGLLNNYLVYILPGCFSMYNMIIIRTYLSSISSSLIEAAKLDGANDFRIAFQIIMPLSKPVLATVALWLAVGKWSDWTTTLYYVTKKSLFTMQYLLMQVLKEADKIRRIIEEAARRGEILELTSKISTDSVRSAQIIITTLPIIMVYPFLQKYFIKGIMLGSVKD